MQISVVRDGLYLRGVLDKKVTGKCPVAVFFHGFSADLGYEKENPFQVLAEYLTDAGLAVVRFDFNGHGKSDGEFSKMDVLNELEDAIAILTYVRKLDFATEIYVVGHSQGAVVAGMLAGCYPDVIKRLVLLAPAATLKADAQRGVCMGTVYDTEHIPEIVCVGGDRPVGGHYFRIAKWLPIYEVTGLFQGPSLVISGGEDTVVSEEDARHYQEVLADCTLKLPEKLDHGLGGMDRESVFQEIVAFLT